MIHDASETLLAREEADRISAELSNGPRYTSGGSRKRKRVEGGLGGGVLAELAEDLDVDDERAKALVSALVRVSTGSRFLWFQWMGRGGREEVADTSGGEEGGA